MNDELMVSPYEVAKWSLGVLAVALLVIAPLAGSLYIAVAGLMPCMAACVLTIRGYAVRNNASQRNAYELGQDSERLRAVR